MNRKALVYLLGGYILSIVSSLLYANIPETLSVFVGTYIAFILVGLLLPFMFNLILKGKPYVGEYRNYLLEFAEKHNCKLHNIYVLPKNVFNAYAVGLWKTKSVSMYSEVVDNCTKDELEGMLAHELGHHNNRHAIIYTTIATLSLFLISYFVSLLHVSDSLWIILYSCMITTIISPVIFFILRVTEHQADEYAKKILNDPAKFTSFLERAIKIHEKNTGKKVPKYTGVIKSIFRTHPPIYDRIEFLKS